MGRATVALPQVQGASYRASLTGSMHTSPPHSGSLNSGSLTGEVLGQGEPDQRGRQPRTVFAVLTIIGAILMLAAFGLIVVALTGDAVSSFFGSLVG